MSFSLLVLMLSDLFLLIFRLGETVLEFGFNGFFSYVPYSLLHSCISLSSSISTRLCFTVSKVYILNILPVEVEGRCSSCFLFLAESVIEMISGSAAASASHGSGLSSLRAGGYDSVAVRFRSALAVPLPII